MSQVPGHSLTGHPCLKVSQKVLFAGSTDKEYICVFILVIVRGLGHSPCRFLLRAASQDSAFPKVNGPGREDWRGRETSR